MPSGGFWGGVGEPTIAVAAPAVLNEVHFNPPGSDGVANTEFIEIFNGGDYMEAVKHQVENEAISKVLYPNDSTEAGKELRLVQQYFFVACSLRDIIKLQLDAQAAFVTHFHGRTCQAGGTHILNGDNGVGCHEFLTSFQ